MLKEIAIHSLKTASGEHVSITLEIRTISAAEADRYDLNPHLFANGGWRIDIFNNDDKRVGVEFVAPEFEGAGSPAFLDNGAELVALGFVDPAAVCARMTADVAEYASKFGLSFEAAVGIAALCGHSQIRKSITQ